MRSRLIHFPRVYAGACPKTSAAHPTSTRRAVRGRLAIAVALAWLWSAAGAYAAKPPYLNAADFPSLQAAIDALGKQRGRVMIPRGVYDETTTPAFVAPLRLPGGMHVRVLGSGREATNLQSKNPNRDLCLIQGS